MSAATPPRADSWMRLPSPNGRTACPHDSSSAAGTSHGPKGTRCPPRMAASRAVSCPGAKAAPAAWWWARTVTESTLTRQVCCAACGHFGDHHFHQVLEDALLCPDLEAVVGTPPRPEL